VNTANDAGVIGDTDYLAYEVERSVEPQKVPRRRVLAIVVALTLVVGVGVIVATR
jgi:hypothetical protein